MRVDHFLSSFELESGADPGQLLATRAPNGTNEFWFYESESSPVLTVMVVGDLACLHYLPDRRHPGFQSRGSTDGPNVEFASSSPTQVMEMPRLSTVAIADAVGAVMRFAGDPHALPACVDWLEL